MTDCLSINLVSNCGLGTWGHGYCVAAASAFPLTVPETLDMQCFLILLFIAEDNLAPDVKNYSHPLASLKLKP